MPGRELVVGVLHLAPVAGELFENGRLLRRATEQATALGARWVVSGELVLTGYGFAPLIGTDWITAEPSPFLRDYVRLCHTLGIWAFVSHPERDPTSGLLYNSLLVIGPHGRQQGRHRKMRPIPISESWSTRSDDVSVVDVGGVQVGLLVCADAYTPGPTERLPAAGAQIVVSAAAWGPGQWGPAGEWEARSREARVPLLVANRTGREGAADMTDAASVLVNPDGQSVEMKAETSTIFVVRGVLEDGSLHRPEVREVEVR